MAVDFGLLDTITDAFTQASALGAFRLGTFSLAALGVASTVAWYRQYGASLMTGSPLGDTLASALLTLIGVGGYYYVLHLLPAAAQLLYLSMTGLAGLVAGDPTLGAQLSHPSTVATAGVVAGQPLLAMIGH